MKTNRSKPQKGNSLTALFKSVVKIVTKSTFIIVAILFLGLPASIYSQQKKMTRKEKEAAWRAERLKKRDMEERLEYHNDSIAFAQAIVAIRNGSWALEASNVTTENGTSNFVTPSTNYISINNGTATIQTAFDNTNIYSPNGLGGITLEGNVSGEELKMDKEGNVIYNYNVQGSNVSATVSMVITAHTNQATANVSPNFSNNTLTLSGSIYPYNSAGVIEGSVSYWLTNDYPTVRYRVTAPLPLFRTLPPRAPRPMPPPRPFPPRPQRPNPQGPPGFNGGNTRPPGFTR